MSNYNELARELRDRTATSIASGQLDIIATREGIKVKPKGNGCTLHQFDAIAEFVSEHGMAGFVEVKDWQPCITLWAFD